MPAKVMAHAHFFYTVTSPAQGHRHKVDSFAFAANGSASDSHVHYYKGLSNFVSGHFHRFEGITGPAIPLPGGGHYHEVQGQVEDEPFAHQGNAFKTVLSVERHKHEYRGQTGAGIGYEPPDW